jgi:hypothetical protein
MRIGSKFLVTSALTAGLLAFGGQKQNPSSDPTRNNPDVPHQEPGTDNPDVGKQRHTEPGATTSTDTGTDSGQKGKQNGKRKGHNKKSTAGATQSSTA